MRLGLLPVAPGDVVRRHLVAPVVLMAGVLLIAVATVIVAGASGGLVGVVVVMVLPTALLSMCCAALSVTNDPFKYVLTPQIGYLQTGFPGRAGDHRRERTPCSWRAQLHATVPRLQGRLSDASLWCC